MTSILAIKIEEDSYPIYNSLFTSIKTKNKYFDITSNKYVYVVNNGQIDVGVILLKKINNSLEINIFQSPNVCRLSILSLIETSILISQKEIEDNLTISFKLLNSSFYAFKFKLIFKEYSQNDDTVIVGRDNILNLTKEEITFREITFLEF